MGVIAAHGEFIHLPHLAWQAFKIVAAIIMQLLGWATSHWRPSPSPPRPAPPRSTQREKRRKAWLKWLKKWVQSMIREGVLYANPLAVAAVRYQYRTSLGVFYFRLFLRVSALCGRAWSICWSSTLVFPVPLNDYTNDMNKCGEHPIHQGP
jgi:hypothetical protein